MVLKLATTVVRKLLEKRKQYTIR